MRITDLEQIIPTKKCKDTHEQGLFFQNADGDLPSKNTFKEFIEVIFQNSKPRHQSLVHKDCFSTPDEITCECKITFDMKYSHLPL